MNAVRNWRSLRQQIIDDARHHPNREAHLEAEEIPQFTEEAAYVDIVESLTKSLTTCDEKPRERLCLLWADYCKAGDDMPMSKAMDFLSTLRRIQLDDLMNEAQRLVDEALS